MAMQWPVRPGSSIHSTQRDATEGSGPPPRGSRPGRPARRAGACCSGAGPPRTAAAVPPSAPPPAPRGGPPPRAPVQRALAWPRFRGRGLRNGVDTVREAVVGVWRCDTHTHGTNPLTLRMPCSFACYGPWEARVRPLVSFLSVDSFFNLLVTSWGFGTSRRLGGSQGCIPAQKCIPSTTQRQWMAMASRIAQR